MPYEAKASFLNRVEKEMSAALTANDMNKALRILADVLQDYRMEELVGKRNDDDDLLQIYLDAMKVQGLSEKSIAHYQRTIIKLMEKLNVPYRQVTVYHLRGWLAAEKERGISDRTLKGNREVFSAFFGWLFRERLIEKSPVDNLGPIKCAKKKRAVLTQAQMTKLEDKCVEMRHPLRNRAIVEFLRASGCRISEVIGLNRDQIDLERLECIVHGKGNKERKVYLDDVAGMVIREYLESRKDDDEALFLNQYGERIHAGGVRVMLNKLAEKANVKNVHPHKFRRTLGTKLHKRGMPINEIAAILGHEKLDTTQKYIVLNDSDLKHDYGRYA